MSETSVSFDLLQTFQILTQFVLQSVGQDLRVLSVLHILRSVQEVVWDLVLTGVLNGQKKTAIKELQRFKEQLKHKFHLYNRYYSQYSQNELFKYNGES